MKKMLFIAAILMFSFANAQKGTVLVAGEIGFNSNQDNGGLKSNTFNFSPKVGYQFSDNLTVGIRSGFSGRNSNSLVPVGSQLINSNLKANEFNIGGFLRYSKPLGGAFSAYADLSAGMQSVKISQTLSGNPVVTKFNGFSAGINPAVAIDLNKGLLLNFSVGGLNYSTIKADFNGAKPISAFSFNFGQQINIGISKNF